MKSNQIQLWPWASFLPLFLYFCMYVGFIANKYEVINESRHTESVVFASLVFIIVTVMTF